MSLKLCFRSQKGKKNGRYSTYTAAPVADPAKRLSMQPVEEGLSLVEITPRIFALISPANGTESAYAQSLERAASELRHRFPQGCKVFNLSQCRSDLRVVLSSPVCGVEECGWPAPLAPPLDRLCALCKQVEQWLSSQPTPAVFHSRSFPAAASLLIAAFLHYNAICTSDSNLEERFAMQRFADQYMGAQGQPSHKRYVSYFSSLLTGRVRVNPHAVHLSRLQLHRMREGRVHVKIYERLKPVWTSAIVFTKENTKFDIDGAIRLRGDVLIKCFETRNNARRVVFTCQLNTCALTLTGEQNIVFHKEELDGIFADPSFDNQCRLELTFSLDQPQIKRRASQISSKSQFEEPVSRSNSYQHFALCQDDSSVSSAGPSKADEYAAIRPKADRLATEVQVHNEPTVPSETSPSHTAGSDDSGIGAERNNQAMSPPAVPPKPRSLSAMAEPIQEQPERRGVLPAAVRPVSSRPPSPREALGRATPSIEPDLVGKDRYDKASKCFSYAPTKELAVAFEKPRRPSVPRMRDSVESLNVDDRDAHSIQSVPLHSVELTKRAESPKWDEEIDRQMSEWSMPVSAPRPPPRRMPDRSQSVMAAPYRGDDEEERPMVMEQARRAVATPTREMGTLRKANEGRRYGSYRTLNENNFKDELDELLDPSFYFSAPKSEILPRKQMDYGRTEEERPSRTNTIDSFRDRNCRSAAPSSDRKMYEYNALDDAKDPDDWLNNKLKKLGGKRQFDPEVVRRRTQEKMLLEELKNAHNTAVKQRPTENGFDGRHTPSHFDPLAEYRREEERLRNTSSPFQEGVRRVRGKPPTPPPGGRERERSRSPRATPTMERRRQQNNYTPSYQQQMPSYSQPRREESNDRSDRRHNDHNGHAATEYDFDELNSIVQDHSTAQPTHSLPRPESRARPYPAGDGTLQREYRGYGSRCTTPSGQFYSGQERVAHAIARAETPNGHMYSVDRSCVQPHHTHTLDEPRRVTHTPVTHTRSADRSADRHGQSADSRPADRYGHSAERSADRYGQSADRARAVEVEEYEDDTPKFPVDGKDRDGRQSVMSSRGGTDRAGAETPAFPGTLPRGETPLPYHPLLYSQNNYSTSTLNRERDGRESVNYRSNSPRHYQQQMSRRSSLNSVDPSDVISHHPVFVKDTSKYWYKPNISREQAINMLRDKQPGTFVVRDSNSFPGAFGLALKVAQPPQGVQPGDGTELVRHFLIEPCKQGVKLKGCNNEPVFSSLSALVYQHSMTALALPTRLILPEFDPASTPEHVSATQALLQQGAACNVTFVGSVDVESLTGGESVRRAIGTLNEHRHRGELCPVSAHFKVSSQGITLTDNTRKLFFRRHYPVQSVIYAGVDPSERRWDNEGVLGYSGGSVRNARIFAFVARKSDRVENSVHVFAELEAEQPASAVVNFINKVMLSQRH